MFDLDTLLSLLTPTGLEIALGIDDAVAIVAATLTMHRRRAEASRAAGRPAAGLAARPEGEPSLSPGRQGAFSCARS